MNCLKKKLDVFARSSSGFTLVEALVAIGIATMIMGMMTGSLFRVWDIERFWRQDTVSTRDLRHAGSWFSRDAFNARTTDLVDGAPPSSSITMTWTDPDGTVHNASYNLVGNELRRTFDSNIMRSANNVISVAFSRSGKTLRFTLTVNTSRGRTESRTLDTLGRVLQ